jgi:diacylglycerol kinase (ATP)
LRIILAKRDDVWSLLRMGWSMIVRTGKQSPLMRELPATTVRLTGRAPIPAQVDGDAFGYTPVEIEPVEEPLTILVAPTFESRLWR